MPKDLFKKAITEFNQRKFYQCHDSLEAIWIDAPETDKRFYQGILQIAVACHHLTNLNLRGAIILLGEGIQRLRDYLPDYKKINLLQLLDETLTLLARLQQIEPENLKPFVDALFTEIENNDYSHLNLNNKLKCQLPRLSIVNSESTVK